MLVAGILGILMFLLNLFIFIVDLDVMIFLVILAACDLAFGYGLLKGRKWAWYSTFGLEGVNVLFSLSFLTPEFKFYSLAGTAIIVFLLLRPNVRIYFGTEPKDKATGPRPVRARPKATKSAPERSEPVPVQARPRPKSKRKPSPQSEQAITQSKPEAGPASSSSGPSEAQPPPTTPPTRETVEERKPPAYEEPVERAAQDTAASVDKIRDGLQDIWSRDSEVDLKEIEDILARTSTIASEGERRRAVEKASSRLAEKKNLLDRNEGVQDGLKQNKEKLRDLTFRLASNEIDGEVYRRAAEVLEAEKVQLEEELSRIHQKLYKEEFEKPIF
jgi:hypothetical protein